VSEYADSFEAKDAGHRTLSTQLGGAAAFYAFWGLL